MRESITVIGASLAGLRGVEALRSKGFEGRISLIGDEPCLPYDRPPLSKQFLSGSWDIERLDLVTSERLNDLSVDVRFGCQATALNLNDKTVEIDGKSEAFDGLLIATGVRCLTLPESEGLSGVYVLRNVKDCLAIRTALEELPRRVLVVGAGFIGSEVASTAVELGAEVTLVETLPVPLMRVLGTEIGTRIADLHHSRGVDLRCGIGVLNLIGDGKVQAANLSDGSILETDLVVVGIGVTPNTDWLETSGLPLDDGICCDETCLVVPDITAAGDVARWKHQRYGKRIRVEHWDNAASQGAHAALRLLQTDEEASPYAPIPWFWSDQYDRKIQVAGLIDPGDDVQIVVDEPDTGRLVAIYGNDGKFNAVFGINRPRHVMQLKLLLDQEATWEEALTCIEELR